jgi:hypothetical protein
VGTRVDGGTRMSHARRPLGKPCRNCGSTSTWVEWRREAEGSRHGGAGEWPYAVCGGCGHAVRGRRTASSPTTCAQSPQATSSGPTPTPEPESEASSQTGEDQPSGREQAVRPRGPARPRASDERVVELLQAAGYNREVTSEVIAAHRRFVSHAGKPGLPRWKAAVSVLNGAQGRGEVPPVSEIYAEDRRRREVKRARAAQRRQQAAELRRQAAALADQHVVAAREYVARVWAETGEGPTWRELGEALGVDGHLASAVVDALHRRGALCSTLERRSLAVAEAWPPPTS